MGFGKKDNKNAFSVHRSEEVMPNTLRHLVRQSSSMSSNEGLGSERGDEDYSDVRGGGSSHRTRSSSSGRSKTNNNVQTNNSNKSAGGGSSSSKSNSSRKASPAAPGNSSSGRLAASSAPPSVELDGLDGSRDKDG